MTTTSETRTHWCPGATGPKTDLIWDGRRWFRLEVHASHTVAVGCTNCPFCGETLK